MHNTDRRHSQRLLMLFLPPYQRSFLLLHFRAYLVPKVIFKTNYRFYRSRKYIGLLIVEAIWNCFGTLSVIYLPHIFL